MTSGDPVDVVPLTDLGDEDAVLGVGAEGKVRPVQRCCSSFLHLFTPAAISE